MGRGGEKKGFHEIDETRASAADDAFEELVNKIKSAGANIEQDETHPLYTDIGTEEYEIGTERTIEFTLNKMEFKLIRKVEEERITGAGHNKSLEPMAQPRVTMVLKKRQGYSDNWETIDLDNMF